MRIQAVLTAAVFAVLALIAAACSSDETASTDGADATPAEPIKIGIIADLTGPFASYGTSLANSAQLAADGINAGGGIAGREVITIVEDIESNVDVTSEKAARLVEEDRVDVVIGPIGSDANDAAFGSVVEEGGTLMLYPETYEGGKCHPLYFSFGAVPAQQIRPLASILQEEYGPFAMLFGADYVWPQRSFEIARPIIEEKGGVVVSELLLPLITDDFGELIDEVRDKQPDYIFSLYPALWGPALQALDDEGLLDGVGIGNIFLGDSDLEVVGSLADGDYAALPFFTVSEGSGVESFLESYAAAFDGAIPSGGESVGAYNAVHMYKAAVEKAGTTEPDAVAEAMVGLSVDGPTGTVTMEPSHHVEQPISIVRSQDGVYSLVETIPAAPPEEDCAPDGR
jgi:urea transport system substrate-binding protein